MSASVLLLGSGVLARSVCCSLAVGTLPMTVTVAARDGAMAGELAYIGNARAAVTGAAVRCRAVASDVSKPLELSRVLGATIPDVVLLAASYQSPSEGLTRPSPWTELVDRAGFGLTAPLHAILAITTAEVVAQNSDARLLVASYPDAVNPILAGLGLSVFAGVGNAALLTASLRAALDVDPGTRVRLLAHRIHLHQPSAPEQEARAWLNETSLPDLTSALAAQRATNIRELSRVVGHITALLIHDLISGVEVHTNLPGPLGLPGGYPVRIADSVELDLPKQISRAEAVDFNRAAARRDGIDVKRGYVRFSERVMAATGEYLADLADGFPVDAVGEVAARLLSLRATLRAAPDL